MKSKDEIIYNMCLTVRHDYGFDFNHKQYDNLFCCLSPEEKQKIWNDMEKIYENFIHGQEEFGEEFEEVLYKNLWKLYQE